MNAELCPNCGNPLEYDDGAIRCPNCGHVEQPVQEPEEPDAE